MSNPNPQRSALRPAAAPIHSPMSANVRWHAIASALIAAAFTVGCASAPGLMTPIYEPADHLTLESPETSCAGDVCFVYAAE